MNQIRPGLLLLATAVLLICASLCAADKTSTNTAIQPLEIPGIRNAFRVTERILSGSQPENAAAFAALAKLGVKTIVSVDGGKPDVEAARKHGLRYVHLPFGYDGIPPNRVVELAKVAAEVSGPLFVHCHHGKHRGPAAVAILCVATEGWTPERGVAWLREAGTAPDYPGLYRAAREFTAPTQSQLAAVKELPEVAPTSSLVDAMVAIDMHFDALKKSQAAGWNTPPGHADLAPPHEATLLWEQLRELARTGDAQPRLDDYRVKLADAERAADSLRKLLKNSANHAAIDTSFNLVTRSCAACHKLYRNL